MGNACNGFGDAVYYSWVIHSLRGAGIEAKLSGERHPVILDMFGVDPAWRFTPKRPTSLGDHPPRGVPGTKSLVQTWVDAYADREGVPLVRPPYVESEAAGSYAEHFWGSRKGATGKRVLVFPRAYWRLRDWNEEYWVLVTKALAHAGVDCVTMLEKQQPGARYASSVWGLGWKTVAAIVKRADLVLTVDTGPAHVAGTIGTPTLAVMGAMDPLAVFGHCADVEPVTVERSVMPCVGCHARPERGWRGNCVDCAASLMVSPWQVVDRAFERLGMAGHVGEHRGAN